MFHDEVMSESIAIWSTHTVGRSKCSVRTLVVLGCLVTDLVEGRKTFSGKGELTTLVT